MSKLVWAVLVVGIFIAGHAYANDATSFQERAARAEKYCSSVRKAAESVQTVRQNGTPIEDVLRAATNDQLRKLTYSAYRKPLARSQAAKKKAIREFGDEAALGCFQAYDALSQ